MHWNLKLEIRLRMGRQEFGTEIGRTSHLSGEWIHKHLQPPVPLDVWCRQSSFLLPGTWNRNHTFIRNVQQFFHPFSRFSIRVPPQPSLDAHRPRLPYLLDKRHIQCVLQEFSPNDVINCRGMFLFSWARLRQHDESEVQTSNRPVPSGLVEVTVKETSENARVRSSEPCWTVNMCLAFGSDSGMSGV